MVCSVTVSRLEFVSVPITEILQSNLYKLPFVERRITKLDWKITIYRVLKFPKIFIFIVFTGCILDLNWVFWKNIFSLEMGKNVFYLGVESKMPVFREFALKNATLLPMPRIDPGLIFFWFLILFIYIINIGQYQVLFIT